MCCKSILLLFILVFCLSFLGKAQKFDKGTLYYNKAKITDTVFYKDEHNLSEYTFKNKYWISQNKDGSDTMYIVEINFDQLNSNIEIIETNKQYLQKYKRTIAFENKYNCFRSIKPICCVKNDVFNDSSIVLTEKNDDILFTFVDTNGTIYLHQYKTSDGTCNFTLDRFRISYLKPHLARAAEYWGCFKNHVQDSTKRINIEKNITRAELSKCFRNLENTRDSISTIVELANKRLQKSFSAKMDSIMVTYLRKGYNENISDVVKYDIRVELDKSVKVLNIDTSNYFPNKPPWYKSIREQIPRHFSEVTGVNEKIPLYTNNPLTSIKQKHQNRCLQEGISDTSVFTDLLDSAQKKLEEFPKQIEVPTLYTYTFAYNQRLEMKKWNLINDYIYERHTKNEPVNPAFIEMVHKQYPKKPNGRYIVGVKNALINNSHQVFDESIGTIKRQYKYMTHIGAGFGMMLDKDFNKTYLDLMFIRHWYGAFAGFSVWGGMKQYFEVGGYAGPCNYVYFKLGIAYKNYTGNDAATSVLGGVSLVFPVVHLEGGYNLATKSPYVMLGVNFPKNR
jgi:hypothetical protein